MQFREFRRTRIDREKLLGLDLVADSTAEAGWSTRDRRFNNLGRHIESYLDRAAEYDRRIADK